MGTLDTSLLAPLGHSVQSALGALVMPFNAVVGFFSPWRKPLNLQRNSLPCPNPARHYSLEAANCQQFRTPPAWPQTHRHLSRPVRVLRVVDASCSAHSAGRMRISGRFADVCAELDRLSGQDAA